MSAPVVVYIGSGPWAEPATSVPGLASGDGAGASSVPHPVAPDRMRGGDPVARPGHVLRGRAMADPYRIRHDFPERWSAYIRSHFRSVSAVVAAFDVSERTARKWLEGADGCNGGNVAVAVELHPETAPAILFDRAA